MNPNNGNQNFLAFLRNNWIIVLAVVGLISGWVELRGDTRDNALRIDKVEAMQSTIQIENVSVKTELAEVTTTLKFIEQKIDAINDNLKK